MHFLLHVCKQISLGKNTLNYSVRTSSSLFNSQFSSYIPSRGWVEIPNAPHSHQKWYAQSARWPFIMLLIFIFPINNNKGWGFWWWLGGKESACQRKRHRFPPWSWRIPHSTEHQASAPPLLSLRSGAKASQPLRLACPRFMVCSSRGPTASGRPPGHHNRRGLHIARTTQHSHRKTNDEGWWCFHIIMAHSYFLFCEMPIHMHLFSLWLSFSYLLIAIFYVLWYF